MSDLSKDFQGTSWKPNFNGTVHCPWASNAPLTATTNCKNAGKCSEKCHVPPKNFPEETQFNYGSKMNSWYSKTKPTITYFNNFVRLMQLFPEMHPASLHTAMSMCKNEFISTVDRLLYVRRYRNGTFCRKEGLTKRIHRRVPHPIENPDINLNKTLEVKRYKAKIKCAKAVSSDGEVSTDIGKTIQRSVEEFPPEDLSQSKQPHFSQ